METPRVPRPFDVGDRVRTTASTDEGAPVESGVVLEFRHRYTAVGGVP